VDLDFLHGLSTAPGKIIAMKIFNHALFPVAVTYIEDFLTSEQARDIFNYILTTHQQTKPHVTFRGDAISSYNNLPTDDNNILRMISRNIISCKDMEEEVFKYSAEFSKKYDIQISHISRSWYNIQHKNSFLNPHKHAGSRISGAIYINVDNESSDIQFENPNPYIGFTPVSGNSENITMFSNQKYIFKPRTGDMIMFPSWLTHHSGNILNQTEFRTVVSFNAK